MPELTFKPFQVEDFCRAAMRDGAILAEDCGLGKSLALFAWPWLKQARRTLLVAPEGLHLQIEQVNRDHFGFPLIRLRDQDDFYRWNLDEPPARDAKPVWFLTTYQALGHNHADEWPADKDDDDEPIEKAHLVEARLRLLNMNDVPADPAFFAGIGEERNGIRCVWKPTLARLIMTANSFDCVVVDEAVRMQSNGAHIATGIRMLNPAYRLILTATPIKNRLESLFWLAWWAAGGNPGPTARWPYSGTSFEREKFANAHLQHDRFITREEAAHKATGKWRKQSRRSARLTNIHRVWKLLAPIIVRRRKEDCGEEIVPRVLRPLLIKPGTQQLAAYNEALNMPLDRTMVGTRLGVLRQIALCPNSESLGELRLASPFSPKMVAVLEIIAECLDRGEQVLVGSPFVQFTNDLFELLKEAEVSVVALDGATNPAKRGVLAQSFKNGMFDVCVAGVRSMGEGHSFENCNNLVLPALDLAYDANKQFMDRVWRINSPKPINVYTVALSGTVDVMLSEVFHEKADSAQLALDGVLTAEDVEEISAEELLIRAIKNFKPDAPTIHEHKLVNSWDRIRDQLNGRLKVA